MELNGKQRRHLRGLGHHLDPVVQVGNAGLTDGVVGAVEQALTDHELIKIRIGENAPEDRKAVSRLLAERTGSAEVQVLGRTVLLYRRHPEKPKIRLP
jgi:RNA-binding protein